MHLLLSLLLFSYYESRTSPPTSERQRDKAPPSPAKHYTRGVHTTYSKWLGGRRKDQGTRPPPSSKHVYAAHGNNLTNESESVRRVRRFFP